MPTPLENLDAALSDPAIDTLLSAIATARATYPNDEHLDVRGRGVVTCITSLRDLIYPRHPVEMTEETEAE